MNLNVFGVDDAVGIAGALTGIVSTIAGIKDAKKRREFQQKLALMSNAQQQVLNNQLLAAQTETERLTILSDFTAQYAVGSKTASEKSKTTLIIVAASLAGILLIGGIFLALKK